MIISRQPALHLTYCLNIHPGETWPACFKSIGKHTLAVRDKVGTQGPFGLGLRLGARAARELAESKRLREFTAFLRRENLYVFTINGFPYGRFHGSRVKEHVYRPDWQSRHRLDYTKALGIILSRLLPEGVTGSISTLPCSFKPWIRSERDIERMVSALCSCARHFHELRMKTGRELALALEPEPGCLLESAGDTVEFFQASLHGLGARLMRDLSGCSEKQARTILRRHIGVCLDTCHSAVMFESPLRAIRQLQNASIRIAKVQLSAGLEFDASAIRTARQFDEPVYLHQTSLKSSDGSRGFWIDLPRALKSIPGRGPGVARTHFHVPLFWKGRGPLRSTSRLLSPAFFAELRAGISPHLEVETYAFNVMPAGACSREVVDSVAMEYAWVVERLKRSGQSGGDTEFVNGSRFGSPRFS